MECKGFSLLELLIVTIILAIFVGLAVPSLGKQLGSARIDSATNALVETLTLARYTAVSKNQRVVIHPLTNWSAGWEIFLDQNSDGVLSSGDTLLLQYPAQTQVSITTKNKAKRSIAYVSSGASETVNGAFFADTLYICPIDRKGDGVAIKIRYGGRVRTEKLSASECAAIVAG